MMEGHGRNSTELHQPVPGSQQWAQYYYYPVTRTTEGQHQFSTTQSFIAKYNSPYASVVSAAPADELGSKVGAYFLENDQTVPIAIPLMPQEMFVMHDQDQARKLSMTSEYSNHTNGSSGIDELDDENAGHRKKDSRSQKKQKNKMAINQLQKRIAEVIDIDHKLVKRAKQLEEEISQLKSNLTKMGIDHPKF